MESSVRTLQMELAKKQPNNHSVVDALHALYLAVESEFDLVSVPSETLLPFIDALENLRLRQHATDELHRVRNNIVSSIGSLLAVTELRMRLLTNDDEWCELDYIFTQKQAEFDRKASPLFCKEMFEKTGLTYFETHPLVQYSMSQLKTNLLELLLHEGDLDESDVEWLNIIYRSLRDRVAVLSTYPYSLDVNDDERYCVRIGDTKAICTSAFVYDFSVLLTHAEFAFRVYAFLQKNVTTSPFSQYAKDSKETFDLFFIKMLKTATGDAFGEEFQAYFLSRSVYPFEYLLYTRGYKNAALVDYKVLQFQRGLDASNAILKIGHETVQELLKRDLTEDEKLSEDVQSIDALLSDEEVEKKFVLLPRKLQCTMHAAILEYVFEREMNVKFVKFYMTLPELYALSCSRTHVIEYPHIVRDLPFDSGMLVVCSKFEPHFVRVDTFYDALVCWVSLVTQFYDGEIYDDNAERISLGGFFRKMF